MPSSKNSASKLIRFDHFMEQALYGPYGYYTSPRHILGARGDFTTTPKLTTLLAEKIALWIQEAWKRQGKILPVIEMGPGDGTLAHDIHKAMGFLNRRKLDYHLVEISPHLRERQQSKTKGTWHETVTTALEKTKYEALLISNEFFDAFPVRIFRPGIEELFITPQGREVWQAAEVLPDSCLFENPPERFEVPESVHNMFKHDFAKLQRGEILSIDYGGSPEEIYHRRPLGTLRAYFQHQRLLPPETNQNPGHQDLTFDVCFDDLIRWGKSIGWTSQPLITQAKFLGTHDQDGAGGAFKVLHQIRNDLH